MTATVLDFEEKHLERISPQELNRYLMRLPVKKRLEAILHRTDAEAVVGAMAAQDFYFSVKEIGPDDALPFLALAKVEQINHLFDLEWWQKDSISPPKAADWLQRLAQASETRLLAWLYQADFELLVTLFKRWIWVMSAPDDIDPLEARDQLPQHTLDDQYFWEVRYPQYEDFISRLLGVLFEVHYGFYKELMNHVISAADVEFEEEAYRFHKGRLEDQAIPDFYDALEIYRAIRPEEITAAKDTALLKSDDTSIPSFALALVPEGDLLNLALQGIQDAPVLDALQMELASLANKVIVADQLPPDNPGALRQAVDKTVAYVNLGLDLASAGDVDLAVNVMGNVFLEHLFRLGQAQVANLRNRMEKLKKRGWLSKWPAGLKCLDSHWLESAELLLGKTPLLIRTDSKFPVPQREDFFRSRKDLFTGKHILDVLAAVGPLLESLRVEPGALFPELWKEAQVSKPEDVTLGSMIWTAAASFLWRGKWEVKPIPAKEWPEMFSRLSPVELLAAVKSWLDEVLVESARRSLAEVYFGPLFQEYAEEMAPFIENAPPDPRLVRFFLFRQGRF